MNSSFSAGGGTANRRARQFLVSAAIALSAPVLAQPAPLAQPPAGSASSAGSASVSSADEPLVKEALQALQSKNPAHALQLLDQYLMVRPKADYAHHLKSRALLELGRYEEAVDASRQATTLNPGESRNWISLCWNQILADQILEARGSCEMARTLQPGNWIIALNIGHTWLLRGDATTAQNYYRDSIWSIDSVKELQEGPLADFDIFLSKGWHPELVQASKDWFESTWPKWRNVFVIWKEIDLLKQEGKFRETIHLADKMLRIGRDVLGPDHPNIALFLNALSAAHQASGEFVQALPLAERALAISEKSVGTEHPDTEARLHHLASLHQSLGQYSRALPLIERALTISGNVNGSEHPDTGKTLRKLAMLHIAMGQWAQALPLAERALAISEKANGVEHAETGKTLSTLALLKQAMGQYAQALPLAERALAISQRANGADHPETVETRSGLAFLYQAMGQYPQALLVAQRALAISEKANGADHPVTGINLSSLATLYQAMGQYPQALPLAQRALVISEKCNGAEHPITASILSSLAALHQAMGHYPQALSLAQRALAISEKANGVDHPVSGKILTTLATLHQAMGQHPKALPLAQRALFISEKANGVDHPVTGIILSGLTALYQAMGQNTLALPLAQRALAINERAIGAEHPETGKALSNLAVVYTSLGRYAQALPIVLRALAISEKVNGAEHPDTGKVLIGLASIYGAMGQYTQALPLAQRALAISENSNGAEHPDTGIFLGNVAALYQDSGQYSKALVLAKRAWKISEKTNGAKHPLTGAALNSLALIYEAMEEYGEIIPLYQRALTISEEFNGPNHPSTGKILFNLVALLHRAFGFDERYLTLLYRAEQIGTASGDRELQWTVRSGIARIFAKQGDPTSAIFWGKQAVNTIQSLRGGLIKLDRELQASFLEDKRWVYTELSQQLIAAGRIAEAQRVMALLKEEELFDFVRRDADSAPARSELPLTGVEHKAAEQYKVLGDRLTKLAQEELRLQEIRSKGGATEADLARLAELEAPLAAAREAFNAFTTGLRQVLAGQAEHREKAALVDRQIESHQNLLADLGAAGQGVAAVQYVASREKLAIIVSTRAIQLAREVRIAEKDLNKHIAELRGLLQDPKLDPRAAAQRLHALLIKPVLADLQAQKVHTLMLLQDGALRYLPFAALHDGQRYLVENYQLAIYTAAAQSGLGKSPAAQWQVAALGVTRAFPEQNFRALDAVRQELTGIVHPQVLPGQIYLDEQFNRTTLLNNLGRPVLHVASHFRFIEGSDQSFLLLGDGSRLSLADLRRMPRFNGVDLLTLSACDTATGGGLREDGREVEGLGVEVQKKGARAVLASLWPVADRSTGELMQRFYRAREGGQRNKAQALRQAQLALLGAAGGDATGAGPSEPRGAKPATAPSGGEGQPVPFAAPAGAPYAHPYYWAPFILMGNWL